MNNISGISLTLAALLLGAATAQAQFFTDNFNVPASATAVQPNSADSPDSNWAVAGLAGGSPTTATIGGGKMTFAGSTGGFSGMGAATGLSADYYYFNAPVTYTISGFSFSGAPGNAAQSWVEIHVGPSLSTVSDQSSAGGPGSTMFVLRLNANGQLTGGSLQSNTNSASFAIDSTNALPGLNSLIADMPTSGVTISLTLSGVPADNGDLATGYKVVVSGNGKTLFSTSGTDTHLLKKVWQATTGEAVTQASVSVLLQQQTQTAPPSMMSLTLFAVAAGNKSSALLEKTPALTRLASSKE